MPHQLIDIGANLTDTMYQGVYGGKTYHPPDLDHVLARAWAAGVARIIITAGNLEDAHRALDLAQRDGYLAALREVAQRGVAAGKCVAIGELGLDYDRLHFCDAATQQRFFPMQLDLARELQLPLFLHSRAAADDFLDIMRRHIDTLPCGGVVHSFDGAAEEAAALVALPNIAIGINGCSLKTEANLATVATIPLDRLMLETDAPWCDIRPSHAAHRHLEKKGDATPAVDRKKHRPDARVKGRNEPASMVQVLAAVAACRGADEGVVAVAAYDNSMRMFFKRSSDSSDRAV